MAFFSRSKNTASQSPTDGPEEWAAKAREISDQANRQRATEAVGDAAVASFEGDSGSPGVVNELSPEFLDYLRNELHAEKGKFLRIADLVLVGPAEWGPPGTYRQRLGHDQFLDVLEHADPELQARLANAQTVVSLRGSAIEHEVDGKNTDGVEDGGYFAFDKADKGGPLKHIEIGGRSGTYGMADEAGRQETLSIVSKILGPNVKVEEKPYLA